MPSLRHEHMPYNADTVQCQTEPAVNTYVQHNVTAQFLVSAPAQRQDSCCVYVSIQTSHAYSSCTDQKIRH